MAWRPTNDFEEEIVSLQPDHNFIYGDLCDVNYPRPQAHLDFIRETQQQHKEFKSPQNGKLSIIAEVQNIARTKPLGELPTVNDWDKNDNIEKETIAMMRYFGMGASTDEALKSDCTIATHPISNKIGMRNGRKGIPVLFDEKYFELKPCKTNPATDGFAISPSNDTSISSSSTDDTPIRQQNNCFVNYTKLEYTSSDRSKSPNCSSSSACTPVSVMSTSSCDIWPPTFKSIARRGKKSESKTNKSSSKHNGPKTNKINLYTAKELYDKKRRIIYEKPCEDD